MSKITIGSLFGETEISSEPEWSSGPQPDVAACSYRIEVLEAERRQVDANYAQLKSELEEEIRHSDSVNEDNEDLEREVANLRAQLRNTEELRDFNRMQWLHRDRDALLYVGMLTDERNAHEATKRELAAEEQGRMNAECELANAGISVDDGLLDAVADALKQLKEARDNRDMWEAAHDAKDRLLESTIDRLTKITREKDELYRVAEENAHAQTKRELSEVAEAKSQHIEDLQHDYREACRERDEATRLYHQEVDANREARHDRDALKEELYEIRPLADLYVQIRKRYAIKDGSSGVIGLIDSLAEQIKTYETTKSVGCRLCEGTGQCGPTDDRYVCPCGLFDARSKAETLEQELAKAQSTLGMAAAFVAKAIEQAEVTRRGTVEQVKRALIDGGHCLPEDFDEAVGAP